VSQPGQRFQRGLDQPVAFLTVHVRQQGEAAAVPEVPQWVVQSYVFSRQSCIFHVFVPAMERYFRSIQCSR
jgi:hypothetical protein